MKNTSLIQRILIGVAVFFWIAAVAAYVLSPQQKELRTHYAFAFKNLAYSVEVNNPSEFIDALTKKSPADIFSKIESLGLETPYMYSYLPGQVDGEDFPVRTMVGIVHVDDMLTGLQFDKGSIDDVKDMVKSRHAALIIGSRWADRVTLNQPCDLPEYEELDVLVAGTLKTGQAIANLQDTHLKTDDLLILVSDNEYNKDHFEVSDLDMMLRNAVYISNEDGKDTVFTLFRELNLPINEVIETSLLIDNFEIGERHPYKLLMFWSGVAGLLASSAAVVVHLVSRKRKK